MTSRALAISCLLWAAGCRLIPCTDDGGCPPQFYCQSRGLGDEGVCTQDCITGLQCEAGQMCDGVGRCIAASGFLEIEITEPAQGAELVAGSRTDVVGTVAVGADPVALELSGIDELGCTPVLPQRLELAGLSRREKVPFRFTGVEVGEGGGSFTVSGESLGVTDALQRNYRSGSVCADCPTVELSKPASFVSLDSYAAGVIVGGRVAGALEPPLLFSVDGAGHEVGLALPAGNLELDGRIVPVTPGDNVVGIEVRGSTGSRRCKRWVRSQGESAALAALLSWEGQTADLDVAIVPPGGRLGSQACRAGSTVQGCSFPTGNQTAPGPEAAVMSTVVDGVYGVVVLAAPGNEGPVRAVASVRAGGAVLARLGPKIVDPSRAESWLVGRVSVREGVPTFEVLDRVQSSPPVGLPESW